MIYIFKILIIGLLATSVAHAENYDSLIGTMRVSFRPIASAGVLEGCELNFEASTLDHAYRQGNPVLGVGSISLYGKNLGMFGIMIKLGVADVLNSNIKPEAPYFAYIKTSKGNTAEGKYVSHDAEMKGYRLFVPEINKKTIAVIGDIIQGENPTIGFNRSKGGIDVMLPLDLSVKETVLSKDGILKHTYSQNAVNGFRECASEVLSKIETHHKNE